jgi:thiazole synthase
VAGDTLDIVAAEPGSGSSDGLVPQPETWRIGGTRLSSRLLLGTGRYDSFEIMAATIAAAETDVATIAVRRERLHDSGGRNILDFLNLKRLVLLPNTSGCYDAETAIRCARMGREILKGLGNPGAGWVKLEVLGDSRSLLPDVVETLKATESLVRDGFEVLCYCNDDPVTCRKLKEAGAASVMPAASPIGSGLGIVNPINLQLILEELKRGEADYPVIVDAGIGTASDAALAMELGADGVLLNTAVARARNPVAMSLAMKLAVQAGRLAYLGGRIGKSRYASASSPEHGIFAKRAFSQGFGDP